MNKLNIFFAKFTIFYKKIINSSNFLFDECLSKNLYSYDNDDKYLVLKDN